MPANNKGMVQRKTASMRMAYINAGSCCALSSTLMRLIAPMPITNRLATRGKESIVDLEPSASAYPMAL